ncbi:MAG: sigma-70 family RNA polymerase sigma factor [Ruminococcus sp.]|uniref:RNA polymerase sigma factor n=1 Tax=Ruminococcus sp. TaxID=41978 RepID=UPI0025F6D471|nr:sigma-70 family RNA polymerase sigma factor [Ruminococcus sp.]MBO4865575.1 sigma-70 family RNA polymerase sigma factor [Ruminococcus sp.]
MTDKELTELLQAEPERGLAEVVEKYSGYVYTIAYSKLSGVCSKEDIEEAVSDIFLSFYEYFRKSEKPVMAVSPYLAVIAKRHSINIYKKHISKMENISFDEIADTVADNTEDRDTRRHLIEAIVSLGRPDSEIFMRKYFFGQKSREIAAILKMKTNTVDKIVSRGLVKLRKILTEQEGE